MGTKPSVMKFITINTKLKTFNTKYQINLSFLSAITDNACLLNQEKEFDLPVTKKKKGDEEQYEKEKVKDVFRIEDMFEFDNISFTKVVDQQQVKALSLDKGHLRTTIQIGVYTICF